MNKKERKKEYERLYYLKNKKEIDIYRKDWLKNIKKQRRNEIIRLLGNKCIICGYKGLALQIDHINGGGRREFLKCSKRPARYYKKILESIKRNEGKYQLLCANCNWEKRYKNNEYN